MGQTESIGKGIPSGSISDELMTELCNHTSFTPKEIMELLLIYRKIAGTESEGGDGLIDEDEFISNLNIKNEKIGHLMYVMLDKDGDHHVDFEEFVYGLNIFLPESPIDEKIDLCFKAYDEDGNHVISKDEIRSIIDMSLEGNALMHIDEAHLDLLIEELFIEYDSTGKGELKKDDFLKLIKSAPGILEPIQFDMSILPDHKAQ